MSGTLYVVATPIGNLEDITLRALRILREADVIAAEDTRRTAKLLAHHGISTRTTSFHEHNARARLPELLDKLNHGQTVALVSDAGTPGVSDPGVELVAAAVARGIAVDPIPGVSAPLTAAVGAGFPLNPLTVFGFAPSRASDRKRFLHMVAETPGTATFFESPHRISATLRDMTDILGNRQIVVARELTKIHQEFVRGTASEVAALLTAPKGEFTVVVGPTAPALLSNVVPDDSRLASEFGEVAKQAGVGRREAVAAVARRYGISARDVYAAVERSKLLG